MEEQALKELIELPWQLQLVIVGGYLGYVVAYSGRRSSHQTSDFVSIALCFGALALIAFQVSERLIDGQVVMKPVISAGAAIVAAVLSAVVWRRWIRELALKLIQWASSSREDGYTTCWETIIQTQNLSYSQLNVTLLDGTIYESYPLGEFNKLPNGPCVLGGDGSVAMYVTHITSPNGERREANKLSTDEGHRITYIPAAQIHDLDMRRSETRKA